jgi:predicted nucleic acid-binding protein
MPKPSVYVETSVISYLVAQPTRDLIVAGHQQLTYEWWAEHRRSFDLFVSRVVLEEASLGDPEMARRRLEVMEAIPLLPVKAEATQIAAELVHRGGLPRKASTDALHIAVAAASGMEYLLTWNCKHIANAQARRAVNLICRSSGVEPPVICTPEELLGEGGSDVE